MGFSYQIHNGHSIAIIGRNGSGKSTLLNMIKSEAESQDFVTGYVPQIIDNKDSFSGGEKFMQALMEEISKEPDLLLLDEPTNHLDDKNRSNLFHILDSFNGTKIIVSHDKELNINMGILWHIHNEKVSVFTGNYNDYIARQEREYKSLENEVSRLSQEKKNIHNSLMKEQERASKSKTKGQKSIDNRKWPTITSKCKINRAAAAAGKKKSDLSKSRSKLGDKLDKLYLPEKLTPKFHINHELIAGKNLVNISNGMIYYEKGKPILKEINIIIESGSKVLIKGSNASGKTSLIKAILGEAEIIKQGSWQVIGNEYIGYLCQHYSNLNPNQTPYELIESSRKDWNRDDVRKHLNDFLLRKNEEVFCKINDLSGGEKARLSLCHIASNAPKLLILDEITNNIDLETKHHISQILKAYEGSLIIISHDKAFVDELDIDQVIDVETFAKSI
jgi:ATPase subunit of ABC transporter with duplicated ATPase domains